MITLSHTTYYGVHTQTGMTYCKINTETHTNKCVIRKECTTRTKREIKRVIVWLGQYPKFDLYVSTPEFAFIQRRIRTTVYRLPFAVKLLLTINYLRQ